MPEERPIEAGPPPSSAHHRPLSLKVRIGLFAVGWILVLIGILGLALPGIQGILTLLIGGAVLSLASERFYRLLERLLSRWPKIWSRLDRWRDRLHQWLHRDDGKDGEDEPPAP